MNIDQYVAAKYLDPARWLAARKTGVTATTIAKAMTPAGYREVVDSWDDDTPVEPNAYMDFGNDMEPWLAVWAKDEFGVLPNDWLMRHESDQLALATPDGISLDWSEILEIKTTGKDWGEVSKIPIAYRRQVQWQLYVTGADICHFVWMLRAESNGVMVPAWFEPKHGIIERDDKMIAAMSEQAAKLWENINERGNNGAI